MVKELRRIDSEEQRRRCFRKRRSTLFAMAREFSEEFGAHVAAVAFAPDGEPHTFGAPTADSVLRTYLSPDEPPTQTPSPSPAAAAETAGEAADRLAGMRRDVDETKGLVAAEWVRLADAMEKIRAAQAAAQKQNWWELDVEALGEGDLLVFVRALEMLKSDVQGRVDAMASARLSLPWREKQQQ